MAYRKGRVPGHRNKDSRKILDAVRKFLETHHRVTVRVCLYQIVSLGLLPSTEHKYEIKLYGLLSRARVAGEIDDAPFTDDHCKVYEGGNEGYANLDEYIAPPDLAYYERNRWQDQPKHPTEIWLEKNTIFEAVRGIATRWDCTLCVGSGCYSRAFLYRAAKDLSKVRQPIVILWCGDCDASGWDIERAAKKGNDKKHDRRREGLADILIKHFDWTPERFAKQVKWLRVAATEEDLKNPALKKYTISVKQCVRDPDTGKVVSGDTKADGYIKRFKTKRCLEIEALEIAEPGSLAKRLEKMILKYGVNQAAWKRSEEIEAREKETGESIE
jgi:hypothetical protein